MGIFKPAQVRVKLSRDLSFEVRINEGRFTGTLKLFFDFAPKTLEEIVSKKIMPQDFLDQVHEFAKSNTWSWWKLSQSLNFYVIVDHIPTEDVQRYIADLFMFLGGYEIFILNTHGENPNMTTHWNDKGRMLLWRKGMNIKYYD